MKCGFVSRLKHLNKLSYDELVRWLYQPTDPASLGVTRFLFGLLMMLDLPEERGGAEMDLRWGDYRDCHFPLFSFLKPPSYAYIGLLYGMMWLGTIGIMAGYKFRTSALLFGIPYWYLLLLDKSYWNNHSYLFGIVTLLLAGSCATHYLSIDGLLDKRKRDAHVPYWNYFILKYQFFMLYFLAGLKKTDMEWLEGYSMSSLGAHWVFSPFRIILTTAQIDYLIIHWCGFLLDLTIGFWLLYDFTRPVAMVFCAMFHLMNSRMFSIGMFPYVCLATMPLFCNESWPRNIVRFFTKSSSTVSTSDACLYRKVENHSDENNRLTSEVTWKQRTVVFLLMSHCGLQAFLPYSHFITKGYNNWTNGLYGYSWDMMVHSWDTVLVVTKVVDNNTGKEHFLDPSAWTQTDRWSKHADMCVQYSQCLKENLMRDLKTAQITSNAIKSNLPGKITDYITSDNISIFIDVWCSLNGRFQQRMYDPNYDLLKANWSPFKPVEWLLPLLSEYSNFRAIMTKISEEVYSWSNYSDVLFIADFPGLYLEHYISEELRNVSLTVLEGTVFYEVEDEENGQSWGAKLTKGSNYPVEVGTFHKVHTVSSSPSCYMYTYVNSTKEQLGNQITDAAATTSYKMKSPFPLIEDLDDRMENFLMMLGHISNSFLNVLYKRPLLKRSRLILAE